MRPAWRALRRLRRQGRPIRAPRTDPPPSPRGAAGRISTEPSCPAPRPSAGPRSFVPTAPSFTTARRREVDRIVRESLALIGTPVLAEAAYAAAPRPPLPPEGMTTMQLTTPQPARHPEPDHKSLRARLCDFRSSGSEEGRRVSDRLRAAPRLERRPDAPHARHGAGPVLLCRPEGREPRFVGLGLEVETRADLEALSKTSRSVGDRDVGLARRRRARAPDRPVGLSRRRDFRARRRAGTAASAAPCR